MEPAPLHSRRREARVFLFPRLPDSAASSIKLCVSPVGCLNCGGRVLYGFEHGKPYAGGLCDNCGPVALVVLPSGLERYE